MNTGSARSVAGDGSSGGGARPDPASGGGPGGADSSALSGAASAAGDPQALPGRQAHRFSHVLESTGQAPSAARRMVTGALREWSVPEPTVANIEIAVSELVSNAVEHGNGTIGLELRLAGTLLLLRVRDTATSTPVQQPMDKRAIRGRGLLIVDALSTRWGYDADAEGKWVWAEFVLPDELADPQRSGTGSSPTGRTGTESE